MTGLTVKLTYLDDNKKMVKKLCGLKGIFTIPFMLQLALALRAAPGSQYSLVEGRLPQFVQPAGQPVVWIKRMFGGFLGEA
jgi:hypothetical protein